MINKVCLTEMAEQTSYNIQCLLPRHFSLQFDTLFSQVLDAFQICLLLRVQTLVFFWV